MKSLIAHEFEKQKSKQLEKIVKKVIASEKIKKSDYSNELVTLEEYLIESLRNNYFSERNTAESVMRGYVVNFEAKFNKDVKSSAEEISKELKDRYDLLFASQIVSNLNKNGMLNADVARVLLNSENAG